MHILNNIEIIDRKTRKYVKSNSATLNSSISSPGYMVNTILNNSENYVKESSNTIFM